MHRLYYTTACSSIVSLSTIVGYMNSAYPKRPYQPLGKCLKALRDKRHESLAEASGAVEINEKQLASFELGHNRPSEDVLLLLISHFGVHDDEAVKIWEMAGYGLTKVSKSVTEKISLADLTPDKRILFTDVVDVIVNNYGVVMNFMQGNGPSSKPVTVARVGMSREHAKSVLKILQVTLAQTERSAPKLPKRIITPDNSKKDEPKA
jgi:transcriptional regulator with XRE-family HTH domain